ncbi:hypothetical protein V757_07380 [Pelistega indica]|uniref:Rap1a immunity protein domain-containing protein n=1 Tax=Pelistega indica TaxID=1414851 RepID=V8G547_9BURK|nr:MULTISPECIES: hypothetical protein [Pelistega]ETD70807.1 hypothetical protein V757_07380 [Pelistega indica]
MSLFNCIKSTLIVCAFSLCLSFGAIANTHNLVPQDLEYWTIARCAGMVSKDAGQTALQDDWYLTASALLERQSYEIEVYEAINEYLVDYLAKSNLMSHQGTKIRSLACIKVLAEPTFRKLLLP